MKRTGFIQDRNEENKDIYLNRPVRIIMQGGTTLGYIHERNHEKVILCPSIIHEPHFDENGEDIHCYRLENEIPTEIRTSAIQGIVPLSEEFIERLLKVNKGRIQDKNLIILK